MKNMKKSTGIVVLIAFLAILSLLGYYSYTVITSTLKGSGNNIKLGLDLAGGVSITYEVVGENPTDEQMADTIYKLQQRIESDLGEGNTTTEASVYQVGSDRITIEIPGVTDANALLEQLGTPGQLYFIAQTDSEGNQNYTRVNYTGDSKQDFQLNYPIEDLIANGSVILNGSDISSSEAGYQTDSTTGAQSPVVDLVLSDKGAKAFGDATTKAYAAGESIGIYYDGKFVSVPSVNAAITDGRCIIEGMGDYDAAANLASYIRIGGLDLELRELQSEIVGAQLGSDALSTSLLAAGIGLIIVCIFLCIMYLAPGAAASLALLLYTTIVLSILQLFEITLTLPGIAGIILSIGMAVDANVIIFARIKEELALSRSTRGAMDTGFQKALSAIIDGNVTTLIAAAVLGVLGSGTVKGFAITLAIGVIVSMFTALFVTRLLLNSFYALGIRDTKQYARNPKKEVKILNVIEKRKIFFIASAAVILLGVGAMGVQAAQGNHALNFSLEFLGGTSTTVNLDKDYSLAEIDSEIVPKISKVTGDNDIQTQKVDNGNAVIFKTRMLNVEEREALYNMFETDYGVTDEGISSENISSTIGSEMRRESIVAVLVAALFMLLYIWFRFKDIRFAASAIAALLHDVLVVLAVYSLARISVGSAFIACMLTVIGYSVNDTIVIFDRVRENIHSLKNQSEESLTELVDRSVSQTVGRSLSTSFTTAVTILMLLILGVSTIKEFAFPLLCGVLVGTYSSIFIATALWYVLKVKIKKQS